MKVGVRLGMKNTNLFEAAIIRIEAKKGRVARDCRDVDDALFWGPHANTRRGFRAPAFLWIPRGAASKLGIRRGTVRKATLLFTLSRSRLSPQEQTRWISVGGY